MCGSRAGIIPIAHSQDTAGSVARTVTNAAILLGALAGVDSRDEATDASRDRGHADYTQFLDSDGLRGVRIGVARRFLSSGSLAEPVLKSTIEVIKRSGGIVVDPADQRMGLISCMETLDWEEVRRLRPSRVIQMSLCRQGMYVDCLLECHFWACVERTGIAQDCVRIRTNDSSEWDSGVFETAG